MEWVEVEAKSVEAAVQAAVDELGLKSADDVDVEVLQQPERGFLGMGGQGAIVRVKPARPKRQRQRGGSGRGRGQRQAQGGPGQDKQQGEKKREKKSEGRQGNGGKGRQPRQKSASSAAGDSKRRSGGDRNKTERDGRNGRDGGPAGGGGKKRSKKTPKPKESTVAQTDSSDRPPLDVQEQADVVRSFLEGLVGAFGLEGEVKVEIIEDDIIIADVSGEQTEALVGTKGSILQSVLDLLKIIVQRKTTHRARIRLDIAGYQARRRAALTIYANRMTDKVLAEGGEVMLEPMNPADRKVVHDAVAEVEGTRSWSEGEEPNRSVLIGLAPGVEPTDDQGGSAASGESEDDPDDGDGDDGDAGSDHGEDDGDGDGYESADDDSDDADDADDEE